MNTTLTLNDLINFKNEIGIGKLKKTVIIEAILNLPITCPYTKFINKKLKVFNKSKLNKLSSSELLNIFLDNQNQNYLVKKLRANRLIRVKKLDKFINFLPIADGAQIAKTSNEIQDIDNLINRIGFTSAIYINAVCRDIKGLK